MKPDQLDHRWIEAGLVKRRSNYSPIIVYETADPRRLYQLKQYILTELQHELEYIFVYDPWDGLAKLVSLNGSPSLESYKKTTGSSALAQRVAEESGGRMTSFRPVLREVDSFMKKWRTLFIIQNVAENRESETGLETALRAWAIDPDVIRKGSSVMIVTSDANALLSELTRELVIIAPVDPSSDAERGTIIGVTARELEVPLEEDQRSELVMATAGLNLHQLESILLEAYHTAHRFDLASIKVLKQALVKRSGLLEVKDPAYGFESIGGYQVIKEFVRRYVINVLKHSERARRFTVPLPKGLLFFGPPGTGKSLFANALAREINLPFINLVTENIYSKWLGESGQNLKNAIRLAEKMSPAIVFVDEIDRFGKRGDGGADGAGEETRRVFSQFLEWLGRPDRQAIIIGTTNVPEHMDEAFLRTGRFDYKIPFLYPGETARYEILNVHLGFGGGRALPPLAESEESIRSFLKSEVVPLTENFSGAELEELVNRAKRLAFDRDGEGLERRDFLSAASSFRIDSARRRDVIRDCLDQARRYTDDQAFLDGLEREMGLEIDGR